jgi:hypothetical protein
MKAIKESQNESQFTDGRKLAVIIKLNKYLRIFLYLIIFTGAGTLLNSCVGGYGYVSSEPDYDYEYARPESPGEGYIWIDGDWLWDNDAHTYIHQRGYWARPRNNRSYQAGHWESRPEGKIWIKGRWSRENERSASRKENNHANEHNRNVRSSPSERDKDHDKQ